VGKPPHEEIAIQELADVPELAKELCKREDLGLPPRLVNIQQVHSHFRILPRLFVSSRDINAVPESRDALASSAAHHQ
jgi:hypothetical protein